MRLRRSREIDVIDVIDDATVDPPSAGGHCPACGQDVEEWAPGPGGRPAAKCPHCFSLERHRHLAVVLRHLAPVITTSRQLLEFAPQPQVRRVLADIAPHLRVVGTDLMDARWIDFLADGCHLPLRSRSIDAIISFHVLEHIPDDVQAMREITRVLSDGGVFIMQVPYRPTALTDEDPSAPEEERVRRFGQHDHVRWYGTDLNDRLAISGLNIRYRTADQVFTAAELQRYNVPPGDPIWIGRPDPAWR